MACTIVCIQPSPSQAHCAAECHHTFGSVSGFDAHRRGGECLDPATLPMHRNDRGIWKWDGRGSHLDGDSASKGTPQAAERASDGESLGSGIPNALEAEPIADGGIGASIHFLDESGGAACDCDHPGLNGMFHSPQCPVGVAWRAEVKTWERA